VPAAIRQAEPLAFEDLAGAASLPPYSHAGRSASATPGLTSPDRQAIFSGTGSGAPADPAQQFFEKSRMVYAYTP